MKKAIDKERKHCLQRLEVYEALALLSLNMTKKNYEWFLKQPQQINDMPRRQIKAAQAYLDAKIKEIKKLTGSKISDNQLLKSPTLQEMKKYQLEEYQGESDLIRETRIWCVSKRSYLDMFTKLENIAPGYYIAPPHAFLQMTYAPHDGLKEYLGFVTPETSLFESMAAQFNSLTRLTEEYKNSSKKITQN